MAKNTTPELPVYVQEVSLEDIAQRRSALHVWVHGYWGYVITIYVERKVEWMSSLAHKPYEEHPVQWNVTMTHSSGGRDTKEVPSDIEAEAYFAQGLMAAVQRAREIRASSAELEKHYQQHAAREQARREERDRIAAVEKAERVAKDQRLGLEGARSLVHSTFSSTNHRVAHTIYAYELGEDAAMHVTVSAGKDSVVRAFKASKALPKCKLIEMLAVCSVRSHFKAQ